LPVAGVTVVGALGAGSLLCVLEVSDGAVIVTVGIWPHVVSYRAEGASVVCEAKGTA
jgi:hypothetical protein